MSEKLDLSDKGTTFIKEDEPSASNVVSGEISELAVIAEGEERVTWFVWVLVACCSISGLLFGMS